MSKVIIKGEEIDISVSKYEKLNKKMYEFDNFVKTFLFFSGNYFYAYILSDTILEFFMSGNQESFIWDRSIASVSPSGFVEDTFMEAKNIITFLNYKCSELSGSSFGGNIIVNKYKYKNSFTYCNSIRVSFLFLKVLNYYEKALNAISKKPISSFCKTDDTWIVMADCGLIDKRVYRFQLDVNLFLKDIEVYFSGNKNNIIFHKGCFYIKNEEYLEELSKLDFCANKYIENKVEEKDDNPFKFIEV
jgi:hypothetical protein